MQDNLSDTRRHQVLLGADRRTNRPPTKRELSLDRRGGAAAPVAVPRLVTFSAAAAEEEGRNPRSSQHHHASDRPSLEPGTLTQFDTFNHPL